MTDKYGALIDLSCRLLKDSTVEATNILISPRDGFEARTVVTGTPDKFIGVETLKLLDQPNDPPLQTEINSKNLGRGDDAGLAAKNAKHDIERCMLKFPSV
jgi:hypothetical protein